MQFQWPTFDQITYRVMRLRRLLAVAIAVPMVVLLSLSFAQPDVLSAAHASLAALGLAGMLVSHVVFFPNVTLETLALSIAATALVAMMPVLKIISLWAPVDQQSGALALLIGFAVALTGVMVALLQIVLGGMVYAGPTLKRVLIERQILSCSVATARQQLTLRPASRRGRVLTGPADDKGFFDVAVATGATPDECVRVDAKVLDSDEARHDVMLLTRTGAVTVTSMSFEKADAGCSVEVRDMPGDFTLGMYLMFWLTDQQADNLTEMTDLIFGRDARANGTAHHGSLVAAAGLVFSPRAPMVD